MTEKEVQTLKNRQVTLSQQSCQATCFINTAKAVERYDLVRALEVKKESLENEYSEIGFKILHEYEVPKIITFLGMNNEQPV